MYSIETTRLGLRNWIGSDTAPFIALCADARVMEFFPTVLSEENTLAMIDRIKTFLSKNPFGLWAVEIKDTHEFIGYTGFSIPRFETDFTPCMEIGWRLAYSHWGKGYAPEAAAACLDYGFTKAGFDEIVSFTSLLNTRSVSVMTKIGMHYIKNFEHPGIEDGHRLKTHVLYAKKAERD